MADTRSPYPMLLLDLNNFDRTEADGSRYVLTSPRSLESCARLGVKPVQLLIQSLNEFIEEHQDIPFEVVTVLYEAYEKKRRKLLQLCREERERIIKQAEHRRSRKKLPALEPVLELESRSSDAKSGLKLEGRPCVDTAVRGKSVSSGRPSRSADIKQPNRLSGNTQNTACSLSLGDLRHSPATERLLARLTRDIKKEMRVSVPDKDCKMAALMLVKHQGEQDQLSLSRQEEQERAQTRKQEEVSRGRAARRRRTELERGTRRWQEEQAVRRRLRERQEAQLSGQWEQEALQQECRWRRLTEELEAQARRRVEAARREAEERKRHQELLLRSRELEEKMVREKEGRLAEEKEQKARRSRTSWEISKRMRLQQENQRELLRHLLLKQEAAQQVEAEQALARSALERRLERSRENCGRAAEAGLRELQERGAREEERVRGAHLRARQQSHQQLAYKQVLAQLSQQRTEQAARSAHTQRRGRAQRARRDNQERRLCHQRLRDRLRREGEEQAARRRSCMAAKEHRRESLRRQREEALEEARQVARASFCMRERVREQTHVRTFDQMALEAQLTASLGRLKL